MSYESGSPQVKGHDRISPIKIRMTCGQNDRVRLDGMTLS